MKFKGTIWLSAAFFGIVLYYFLVDLPTEKKHKEEKERSEKVLLFDRKDVEGFSLTKGEQTLQLQRKGEEGWKLLQPLKAEADKEAAASYLSRLEDARFSRVVEESPKDPAVYGLKTPSLKITLKLKGQGEKTLLVGDENPMRNYLYVQREGEKKVLLATVFRKDLDRSLFDLRDKTLLDFENEAVRKIKFLAGESSFDLVKNEKQWEIVKPVRTKADPNEVRRFLNSVKFSRIREFVEEKPETLTPFGLDTPVIQLVLEIGKEAKTLSLLVGNQKNEAGFFGKTGDASNVVLLGKNLVETLTKKPVDFMDKILLEFKEDDVAQIQLRSPKEEIEVVRDKDEPSLWKLVKPKASRADTAALNNLLLDLKEARIKEFVKISMQDPSLFGLDRPVKELTLHWKKGAPWTLKLGNKSTDGKYYFAGRTGDSTVFMVSGETVSKIFPSLHALKYKKLLSFKSDDVHRILIETPKKTFELRQNKKNWDLLQPEKIKSLKAFQGKDILWTLRNLEYESIVEPPLSDQESGLDNPRLAVSIWKGKNRKIAKILVGNSVKDRSFYYARVEGQPSLYIIKSRFLDEIPRDLKKFKS
ncbi:MAG: DUF4340 domain-containing protein [Nitrospinaceae bacterium]